MGYCNIRAHIEQPLKFLSGSIFIRMHFYLKNNLDNRLILYAGKHSKGNVCTSLYFEIGRNSFSKWLPPSVTRCYKFSTAAVCLTFSESKYPIIESGNCCSSRNNKSYSYSISSHSSTSSHRVIKINKRNIKLR